MAKKKTMRKFEIRVLHDVTHCADVVIEAEDEEAAKEIARQRAVDGELSFEPSEGNGIDSDDVFFGEIEEIE